MLIYSKDRLVPTAINMMALEDSEGAYYYVHRSLYDQAVVLEDAYGNNLLGLRLMVAGARSRASADYFFAHAPKPLNVLGVYLELVDGDEDFGEDIELMCGIIHVMSAVLNFRKLLKIEVKIRASVRFSLSVKEEYQLSWDRFFAESLPFGNSMYVPTVNQTQPDTAQQEEDDDWGFLDEPIDFDEIEVPGANQQDEEETPKPVEVKKEEIEEAPMQSGLARVKGWV